MVQSLVPLNIFTLLNLLGQQVGDTAMVGVLSTCPCNFTYHYEVMSRGNIVTSGTHRAFHSYKRNKRNLDPLADVLLIDDVMRE